MTVFAAFVLLLNQSKDYYKRYRMIGDREIGNLKRRINSKSELKHNILRRIGQLIPVDIFTEMFLFMGAVKNYECCAFIFYSLANYNLNY